VPSFPTSLASGDCHLQHTEDGDDFSDANGDECGDEDAAGGEYEYYFGPPLHERRDSFCEPLLDDRFGMNERGAHFWPTAMFTGGVFGSQHSQHSQQPYSGQYSQQREVGLQQPAVPAAVGSSFFGLHYSEQPCSGQQPTVVTAAAAYSFGLGQQPPSDGELQEQPAGFGQPTVVTATAGFPSGSSIRSSRAFRSRRRRQQQPWRASADCSASGRPRRQLRTCFGQLRTGAFAGRATGMRREEEMW